MEICLICGKPVIKDKYPNREEYVCESYKHIWHKCAIHRNLAIGGAPLILEKGIMMKDLKQKQVCSCYLNDEDLSKIYPYIKGTDAEKVFIHLSWRLRKVRYQQHELQNLRESAKQKNLELDALHYVWCNGGCKGGVHRYKEMEGKPLTKEIVEAAEWSVKRMRIYYENKTYRDTYTGLRGIVRNFQLKWHIFKSKLTCPKYWKGK